MAPIIADEQALSEHDHTEAKVRRNNLVQLFLDELQADKYISTHLYGAMKELDLNLE